MSNQFPKMVEIDCHALMQPSINKVENDQLGLISWTNWTETLKVQTNGSL